MFRHPNSHPYDSGLIVADESGVVSAWLTKEHVSPLRYRNRVNAGLHVISPMVLEQIVSTPKVGLDCRILRPLAGTGAMFCYDSTEYV